MVYRCCLFIGEVAPYSDSKEKASLPYVPFLRTCKAVHVEAEPIIYENTFLLSSTRATKNILHHAFPTPVRKLLLKAVKVSLHKEELAPNNETLVPMTYIVNGPCVHSLEKARLSKIAWQRKITPILEHLTLNRLILDLGDSVCRRSCKCSMAAMAMMCFEKGFALQVPKTIEVQGQDAGRVDVAAVLQECSRVWTMKRRRQASGYSGLALAIESEAEKWLRETASKERRRWVVVE